MLNVIEINVKKLGGSTLSVLDQKCCKTNETHHGTLMEWIFMGQKSFVL
jgi:hypothetical protein